MGGKIDTLRSQLHTVIPDRLKANWRGKKGSPARPGQDARPGACSPPPRGRPSVAAGGPMNIPETSQGPRVGSHQLLGGSWDSNRKWRESERINRNKNRRRTFHGYLTRQRPCEAQGARAQTPAQAQLVSGDGTGQWCQQIHCALSGVWEPPGCQDPTCPAALQC